jgi:hypothetical protein
MRHQIHSSSVAPGKTHRRLKHRRHLGQRGFHQHLLETPEQAAGQQQRDGGGVEVVFAHSHGGDGTGLCAGAPVTRATAATPAVAGATMRNLFIDSKH